jgi:hypothetical protein
MNDQTPGQAGQYPDMSGCPVRATRTEKPDIRGALSRRESPCLSGLSGAPSFVRGPASKQDTHCPALGFLPGDTTATREESPAALMCGS